MTNFEKITASPETLAAVLAEIPAADSPWDRAFRETFCARCSRKDCDAQDGGCPNQEKRENPGWWLGLEVTENGTDSLRRRAGPITDP